MEGTRSAEMSNTRVKAASSKQVTFSPEKEGHLGNSRGRGEWPLWREGPYERLDKERTEVPPQEIALYRGLTAAECNGE